jgi:hypothetical protein
MRARKERVSHILTERLKDGDYCRTLCGRIVEARTAHLYSNRDYWRHESPNCQDCLKAHFDKRDNSEEVNR